MDANLLILNQMSYQQQQHLMNSRQQNLTNNRNHYSNRQIDQSTLIRNQQQQHQQQQQKSSSGGSSGSDNDDQQQLSNTLSTTTTNKTISSQQAMLSHNNKTSSHQQHLMQQHQQQQKRHQQQQQHRQQALQAHALQAPGKAGYGKHSSADNMTSTSSSDHTIDDLHQLAGSSGGPYHHTRLTGTRYSDTNGSASAGTQSGGRFLLGVLFTLAELLLFASVLLWLYWSYEHDDGLAWQNDRKQQFNTHAALMLLGFIFLNGQAMLIYRSFQCCSKIYTKILHTILLVLATSAISLGLILGYTAQENVGANNKPIMHFYSLHAWCGLITVALFVFQFVFGFVTFLILLCCDSATSKFRQALLPIHKTFGLIIFSLAIATCLTGLLQTARSRLR